MTFLASTICETPIALISLVDSDRQWFKSKQGLDAPETPRDFAFCAHAILGDEPFYVEDAHNDERFFDNPLVTDGPKVAFYAGVPLKLRDSANIGTLCIIDHKPRVLNEKQKESLNCLARQVEVLLEMRLSVKESEKSLIDYTLMERTQSAARIGSWQVDLTRNSVVWSKMTYEIHELKNGEKVSLDEGINFYVEEDRPVIAKCVEECIANGTPWNEKLRILTTKGNVTWVQAIGFPVYENDKVVKIEGTFQDIDYMIKTQEKLEQAMVQSKKALVAKSEFLANMSHEIRTPLNGVIGFTDLILGEDYLTPIVRKNAQQIKTCSHNLLVIINDILDLSKMNAGKLKLKKTDFNLTDVIDSSLEVFKVSARNKEVDLSFEFKTDVPNFLLGDHQKIRQILLNLVGNAMKFTHKGFIKLEVFHDEVDTDNEFSVHINVLDTGIGIPEESLNSVFNSFEQVDNKNSREYGGTGLGLPICKKLVKMMGGDICVESSEGSGSIFKFSFKVQKAKGIKEFKRIKNSKPNVELIHSDTESRILVAEDNKINSLLITKLLNKFGYKNVVVVSNGKEAIEVIQSERIDLVFMDIQMPVMDGREATELLRDTYSFDGPIIGLSANAFQEDFDNAKNIGMDDYIEKPISLSKLQECLVKFTSSKTKAKKAA